jgi:hypothetical protein
VVEVLGVWWSECETIDCSVEKIGSTLFFQTIDFLEEKIDKTDHVRPTIDCSGAKQSIVRKTDQALRLVMEDIRNRFFTGFSVWIIPELFGG